jgi:hypothetical protein
MLAFLRTNDSMTGAVASTHIEPVVFVNWDGATSPEDMANTAYTALAAKTAGRRCLFFRHLLDGERTGYTQAGGVGVEDWFVQGVGCIDRIRSDMTRFWRQFKSNGSVRADYVYLDEEDGQGGMVSPGGFTEANWTLRAAKIAKVNNDTYLKRFSPPELRGYTEANIAAFAGSWSTQLGKDLMHWANRNHEIFLNCVRVVVGVYGTVMGEAMPLAGNYADEITTKVRYGLQAEPYWPGRRSTFGMNIPNLFLNRFSSLPALFTGQTSAHRWLMFLYNNNWMRALNRQAPFMPEFSYPSWDGLADANQNRGTTTGWRYQVQAAAAMGMQVCQIWSPGDEMGANSIPSLSTQLAYMEATLADLPERQVEDTDRLAQIAYNATTVTIGSWSVTYSAGDWGTT